MTATLIAAASAPPGIVRASLPGGQHEQRTDARSNVKSGANKPTIPPPLEVLGDAASLDRTTINAWEDVEFRKAVEATGRKKLIVAALWTEACLLFPSLDAMRVGYEIFVPVDSVGGTSVLAHEAALRRLVQAGARLTSIPSLLCELQRDWARRETVPAFVDLLFKRKG